VRTPVVIIGNGAAAAEAVLALRQSGFREEIQLFADNEHPPYNPMLGTYLVSGAIPRERVFPYGDHETFYAANQVSAHLGEVVVDLDAEARMLTTAGGATCTYERCLVATGARPAVPPIAGLREALSQDGSQPSPAAAGADGVLARRVFTIQSFSDALRLKETAAAICAEAEQRGGARKARGPEGGDRPRAAVVGASFAGIKIASVLHEMGMRVTLVEREASILPLSAHPDCARILEHHLLVEGYELRLGAALLGVEPHSSGVRLDFGALPGAADPEASEGTACEDQEARMEVELLVVCTGNRPSLAFLRPGQIDTGVGVLVDEELRSSIPSLYAAGDVAQGKNLLSGRHEIIGLWASARCQGRAAGRSMAGMPTGYRGSVPSNITHVGRLLFASVGCLRDYDRIETSHQDGAFRLRAWQEGRLAGVNLINSCLNAGVIKQALLKAATGATAEMEATWTSFSA
jgi:NADPH-dependent 2,4-dienoyl-CoA reductase/sulfur reductase-like enzyme